VATRSQVQKSIESGWSCTLAEFTGFFDLAYRKQKALSWLYLIIDSEPWETPPVFDGKVRVHESVIKSWLGLFLLDCLPLTLVIEVDSKIKFLKLDYKVWSEKDAFEEKVEDNFFFDLGLFK